MAATFDAVCAAAGREGVRGVSWIVWTSVDGGYWDDVHGGWLSTSLVAEARKEELKCIHPREVYEEADVEQCYAETSRPPTSLRWVDTNKGTEKPRIRSRLVVRELRCETQHMEAAELFSAMPPLEALILMVSILVERHRIMWGGKLGNV